jgi:hypothetical protein
MGLQVIAEGIEDLDQAAWLLDHGCAMAQGYAFGRPAPLPSPAEVLMGELLDAPAEIVAGELMDDPLPPQELPLAEPAMDPQQIADGDYDTGRLAGEYAFSGEATGELFDELADESDED